MHVIAFLAFLVVVADRCRSFRFASLPLKRAAISLRMGWSDAGWNWGSAIGEAHNVAMTTRQKFGTETSRNAYIQNLGKASSISEVDIEELKMVLALRFQRAAREGKDGNGRGWDIMCNMAECKYEKEGIDLLKGDLQTCIENLPKDLVGIAILDNEGSSTSMPAMAAQCLAGTDFIRIGL